MYFGNNVSLGVRTEIACDGVQSVKTSIKKKKKML